MPSFVDNVIAIVVSSELEGDIKSEEEREGDGVKMTDEGRKVVWTAAAESLVGRGSEKRWEGIGELLIRVATGGGVISGDGVVCRETVVSTVYDDVMSNTLGSRGSPLPLLVIPVLGGGGRRG